MSITRRRLNRLEAQIKPNSDDVHERVRRLEREWLQSVTVADLEILKPCIEIANGEGNENSQTIPEETWARYHELMADWSRFLEENSL